VLPPPPTCTPPQVPGPDGTCLCAAPNVMVNGKCTARKADEKKTEKKPEPCPEGTHRVGKRCVKNESKEPRIKTEDVIRGIDIMRGIGGGGGGGGRNPTGGGASPGGGGTKR